MTTPWLPGREQGRVSPFSFHRQLGQGTLPKLNTMGNCPQPGITSKVIIVNTVWRQCFQAFFHAYTLGVSAKIDFIFLIFFVLRKEYSRVEFTQDFLLNSIVPWCLNYITPAICDSDIKKIKSIIC